MFPPARGSALVGGNPARIAQEEFKRWKSVVWECGEGANWPHADREGFNLRSLNFLWWWRAAAELVRRAAPLLGSCQPRTHSSEPVEATALPGDLTECDCTIKQKKPDTLSAILFWYHWFDSLIYIFCVFFVLFCFSFPLISSFSFCFTLSLRILKVCWKSFCWSLVSGEASEF